MKKIIKKSSSNSDRVIISMSVNEEFRSLYKLGYFIVDLNSICNFAYKINNQSMEEARTKKYSRGITSRNSNKDSLKLIELVEFHQGSFHSEYVAPIIVGVVLLFASKYINQEQNKIEITTNNTTINNIIINNTFNYDYSSFSQDINDTVQKLIDKEQLEQSGILYDEEGKKRLFQNIVRMKKLLNDYD